MITDSPASSFALSSTGVMRAMTPVVGALQEDRDTHGTASTISEFSADGKKVRADSDHGRLGLQEAGDIQHVLPERRVLPPGVEVLQQPGGTFDAEDPDAPKPRGLELALELVRTMKVGRREVVEVARVVAMLAVDEV